MKLQGKKVLITGTTSGLGRELMGHFCQANEVFALNRRSDTALEEKHKQVNFEVIDITDFVAVKSYLEKLKRNHSLPDIFILNAGINQIDNVGTFSFTTFKNVTDTNTYGVMTFVGAIQELGIEGVQILAMTSTSSIVANPGHLSYFLSKLNLEKAFRLLARNDSKNLYQTLSLGPIKTNIMANYGGPQGFSKVIVDFLMVPCRGIVAPVERILTTRKKNLKFPYWVHLFYYFVRFVTSLIPGVYKGSQAPKALAEAGSKN